MELTLGVVFDLDDTLYLERDYVRSGFSAVASFAAADDSDLATAIHDFLWETFEAGVRGRNFDLLLDRWPSLGDQLSVAELVEVYRWHQPTIKLLEGAEEVIRVLRRRRVPLGLISDGPVASQSAKVKALEAESFFDAIIFTDSWGREYRKPHERAYACMEERLVGARPLVYIADNPAKDFIAAKSRGWRTIRMRLEGQLHRDSEPSNTAATPDFDLSEFDGVIKTLEGMKLATAGNDAG